MKHHFNQNYLLLCLALLLFACKKKSDDTNNGGGNNGGNNNGGGGSSSFNITGTSPEYLFWGDELTINGTGFSTNKADYSIKFYTDLPGCNMGAFEIISATASQLKVKTPIGAFNNSITKCGPSGDPLVVTINGKNDTTDLVKFYGWPRIQGVCTHFGGAAGNYLYPGDSTAMNMSAATGIWAVGNNMLTNATLTVDGANMPVAWRTNSGCTNSLSGVITLDKELYGKLKCPTDADWGGGGRNMLFRISNPGTNRFDTLSIFVYWMPKTNFSQYIGAPNISVTAGGFPQWKIYGVNMRYQKARFTSTDCNLTPQDVEISHNGTFYDEGIIPIPLSVMTVGCNYSVSVITNCGESRVLGPLRINP